MGLFLERDGSPEQGRSSESGRAEAQLENVLDRICLLSSPCGLHHIQTWLMKPEAGEGMGEMPTFKHFTVVACVLRAIPTSEVEYMSCLHTWKQVWPYE
jgi:hypothetical protein